MERLQLPVAASGATAAEVARACAAAANAIIVTSFRQVAAVEKDSARNVVTAADLASEEAVRAILAREYPGHVLLGEETAATAWSDGWMWVVDPIDGTKNFSRGIPHFAFNLALCIEGEPVLGLTTHPLLGWEILAVAGEGCRFNGTPVTVGPARSLAESVVAVDLGYNAERGLGQLDLARRLWPAIQSLRIPGSAALGFAYAATGAWDLYIHANLAPWDVAAGLIQVREAGGVVTNHDGTRATLRSEGAIAGAPGAHADLLRFAASEQQGR